MARADRIGRRKGRDHALRRVPDLGCYFIVTDTNATEGNYIYGLRDSLPKRLQDRIVIKVIKARTENLIDNCKTQASLEPKYGEPWIIFDRDQVPKFDEIIREAEKEGINVGWSNPCIEIWFDAYFGRMHSYQNSVQCWKRFAETYERVTGQEYNKANRSIYQILNRYGDEEKAVEIAEKRYQSYLREGKAKPSDMCPCTTVQHLVDEIRKKTIE